MRICELLIRLTQTNKLHRFLQHYLPHLVAKGHASTSDPVEALTSRAEEAEANPQFVSSLYKV